MAQIFASDHGNKSSASATRATQDSATTAPEQALAALQTRADGSTATARLTQLQAQENAPLQRMEDEEPLQGKAVQRMEDEEALQGKAKGEALQRMEDEEPMQGKAKDATLQRQTEAKADASDSGGMPGGLRAGIEQLSGADMSGVRVHYNSSAPAQLNAHAYAQGSDIHLANGQEKHLPHEAWHVAQQQQGRVKPTMDVGGTPVNDDPALEKEADVMGAKATQMVDKDSVR